MTSYVQILAEAKCPECDGNGIKAYSDFGGDCPTCNGTGALVLGLRRECTVKWGTPEQGTHQDYCTYCQGRGWVLIPEAEQMGVLCQAEMVGGIVISKATGDGVNIYFIVEVTLWDGCSGDANDLKIGEALAHAICQAKGIN